VLALRFVALMLQKTIIITIKKNYLTTCKKIINKEYFFERIQVALFTIKFILKKAFCIIILTTKRKHKQNIYKKKIYKEYKRDKRIKSFNN